MTLEEFASQSGLTVVRCDREWGGTYGYKLADYPNMQINGFRTEKAALLGWMKGTFGERTAKALVSLFKKVKP
jgi:hypothetical protein